MGGLARRAVSASATSVLNEAKTILPEFSIGRSADTRQAIADPARIGVTITGPPVSRGVSRSVSKVVCEVGANTVS